jgi:hypothetical protein
MTEPRDRESERTGDAETEPKVDVEPIKDLDVDAARGDDVRGGQSYGGSAPTH